MSLSAVLKRLEKFTIDNSPAILTGVGIAGVVGTAYLSGKASIKAYELSWAYKDDVREDPDLEQEIKVHYAKKFAKVFAPPVASGVATIACIYGANHISSRRAAAMATAYSLTEKAFTEYKEKVVEKVGEKKEQSYRDEIMQDRVREHPPEDRTVLVAGGGEVLCYDKFTGRYFRSDMETIRRAENDVNQQIINDGYASVSDLFEHLGLPVTSFSEEVGWNTDKLLTIQYSTVLSPDNQPCISIDYDLHPNRKYAHFAGE